MSDLDEAALARWMADAIGGDTALLSIEPLAGGQSNPTYRMRTSVGDLVLRRKPYGTLLPSAHAIEREHRVISALHPTGFPVPRPVALCEDARVIGAPFFLMEMVEGRSIEDGRLAALAVDDRRDLYDATVDCLAALHAIDPDAVGLGGYGRPGNFAIRQVSRWTRQYRASQTEEIAKVERLIEWLPRTAPDHVARSLVHGDYRIDNVLFTHKEPRVLAVLDWELSTIGDPLADFAYFATSWILPADGRAALGGVDLNETGLPSLDDIIHRYCLASGRDAVPGLNWYFAFNLFRTIGIVQGIRQRAIEGNASSTRAEEVAGRLPLLVEAAWEQARMAGASN